MNLKEIFKVMGKLGFTAFGGPAAHIAMLQEETVEKRKWISKEHFIDLMGVTNIIPGPNSTQMAMHLSLERGGFLGLLVGTFAFVGPAVFLTLLLAIVYYGTGEIPHIEKFFFGIKPVAIAIITMAVVKLGQKALNTKINIIVAVLAGLLAFTPLKEVYIILFFGLSTLFISLMMNNKNKLYSIAPIILVEKNIRDLFLSFLKIGSTLFGSGYLLVAYLNGEFVDKLAWLSHSDILDAIAMGQFTPGPVLTSATFVGYQILGIPGALIATLGIFLPSILFVYLLNPQMEKLKKNIHTKKAITMFNSSAVGVMGATAIKFLYDFRGDIKALILVGIAFYLTIVKKVSSIKLILVGMVLGTILSYIF